MLVLKKYTDLCKTVIKFVNNWFDKTFFYKKWQCSLDIRIIFFSNDITVFVFVSVKLSVFHQIDLKWESYSQFTARKYHFDHVVRIPTREEIFLFLRVRLSDYTWYRNYRKEKNMDNGIGCIRKLELPFWNWIRYL